MKITAILLNATGQLCWSSEVSTMIGPVLFYSKFVFDFPFKFPSINNGPIMVFPKIPAQILIFFFRATWEWPWTLGEQIRIFVNPIATVVFVIY